MRLYWAQPKPGGRGIVHQATGVPHVESWVARSPVEMEGHHNPSALLGFVAPGDVRLPRVGAMLGPCQQAADSRLFLLNLIPTHSYGHLNSSKSDLEHRLWA